MSVSQYKKAVSQSKHSNSFIGLSINKHSQAVAKHQDDVETIEGHLREYPIYNVELMQLLAVVSGHKDAAILQSSFSLPHLENEADNNISVALPKSHPKHLLDERQVVGVFKSGAALRQAELDKRFSVMLNPPLSRRCQNGSEKKSRG